jgi:hypothetical protein
MRAFVLPARNRRRLACLRPYTMLAYGQGIEAGWRRVALAEIETRWLAVTLDGRPDLPETGPASQRAFKRATDG